MSEQHTPVRLEVNGMTCVNCAQSVSRSLEKDGAENVEVNFVTKEAAFNVTDPSRIPDMIAHIEALGYRAGQPEHTGTHDHSHHEHSHLARPFWICAGLSLPLVLHMFLPNVTWLQNPFFQLALSLPVYLIGMYHFGRSAWASLKSGVPNMDVLITVGSSSAFFYSLAGALLYYGKPEMHHYLFFETAATIITLILLGNLLEEKSVRQTTTALAELNKLRVTKAKVLGTDGQVTEKNYEDIRPGDKLLVNTGDKVPVDGVIYWGDTSIDESMVTGESIPVDKHNGDPVTGGTILVSGSIKMAAKRVGNDTLLSKIIELVKQAQLAKPPIQKLGDRVSAVFVPAVLVIALATLLVSAWVFDISWQTSLMRSVAVLVISCPCAMGLATPTAVMAGLGRAAKKGILIKGGDTLESFARIKQIVFDKTGTLTTGRFHLAEIRVHDGSDEGQVKSLIRSMETHSDHPIAKSLVEELASAAQLTLENIQETKGGGISARTSQGDTYLLGSARFTGWNEDTGNAALFLVRNGKPCASIRIEDELKPGVKEEVTSLKKLSIRCIMVSGDKKDKAEQIAAQCGIEEVYSEQSPENKMSLIASFSAEAPTAMVGDGVNDAPALAKASVGISIGNATQAAIHSAQIVLLSHTNLEQLAWANKLSRQTLKTIKQNLFWAFFYNVIAIPIAAAGYLNPMIAALAMAFSDVIVIGNSIRLKTKRI